MCEFLAYVSFNKATNGQTDNYRKGEQTYLNVTVEDHSWKASSLAKIEFGNHLCFGMIIFKSLNEIKSGPDEKCTNQNKL